MTIGVFYGTQTGNTESAAAEIQRIFGSELVDLHDVAKVDISDFEGYDCLIIGCPTWNIGELQSDWEGLFPELDDVDFSGKKVAYFGCGDQVGYADNFLDAIGILEAKITERGGKTVGYWSTDGYDFDESRAVRGNKFVGLALDDTNQADLTEQRLRKWVALLRVEFGV
ncbi:MULTISPECIES: flavodoxin FldA [Pseudanabaena]|uniref:Flavodoxin n=2 Tax=Pseudanabaena TaxID=1152 RepID=L8MX67_9CYAN|nr:MULTISPECIES: flavodoxin FldA [Pseudanabaena]ELS30593.1 flavodoxin [Pseudanabaena biceps PCC 7429]MDG3497142.1 flavodoxin FldA [Pseudanabaena catenata USMAC16]